MQNRSPSLTTRGRAVDVLPWGFSSLGCGDLTLPEMCELLARFDLHALELRAVDGGLDVPGYLDEIYPDPAAARDVLDRFGVRMVSLDSSFKLIGSHDADREALLAFVPWAEALGVPYIRVFGGGAMDRPLAEEELTEACGQCRWWSELRAARGWEVDIILETHDGFSASDRCLALQAGLRDPLAVIWDTHHTWKMGGEEAGMTWDRIGHLVRHVHIKDSVSVPSARHPYSYVLPGAGEFPAADTLRTLADGGYEGVVCLEWERQWHPYLPPLEDALVALRSAGWRV